VDGAHRSPDQHSGRDDVDPSHPGEHLSGSRFAQDRGHDRGGGGIEGGARLDTVACRFLDPRQLSLDGRDFGIALFAVAIAKRGKGAVDLALATRLDLGTDDTRVIHAAVRLGRGDKRTSA